MLAIAMPAALEAGIDPHLQCTSDPGLPTLSCLEDVFSTANCVGNPNLFFLLQDQAGTGVGALQATSFPPGFTCDSAFNQIHCDSNLDIPAETKFGFTVNPPSPLPGGGLFLRSIIFTGTTCVS